MEYVKAYWRVEVAMLERLAEKDRADFHGAGFPVSEYYGPAPLARYALEQHEVKEKHMAVVDIWSRPQVTHRDGTTSGGVNFQRSAQIAYMGGRFELFRCGHLRGPLYCYDRNSAYVYAISLLWSMRQAQIRYRSGFNRLCTPNDVSEYGLYHVKLWPPVAHGESDMFQAKPNPLFHRSQHHLVSFPSTVEGWYWGPEVKAVLASDRAQHVQIKGGWEIANLDSIEFPFAQWVPELYAERLRMKAEDNPNEHAVKGCLASMYGVMAQVKGHTLAEPEKNIKDQFPKFHQLEWAGWVTSHMRAELFRIGDQLGPGELVAYETDSVMSTVPLDLPLSNRLGDWKLTVYDEGYYLQSGMGWFRKGDVWEPKRRGMDPDTFTLPMVQEHVRDRMPALSAEPGKVGKWEDYKGKSTRFIGLGGAFPSNLPMPALLDEARDKHCHWITRDHHVAPGGDDSGKRHHTPSQCPQCLARVSADVEAHQMVAAMPDPRQSLFNVPHSVPWLDRDFGDTESFDRGMLDLDLGEFEEPDVL
jgi:hypothetical protein